MGWTIGLFALVVVLLLLRVSGRVPRPRSGGGGTYVDSGGYRPDASGADVFAADAEFSRHHEDGAVDDVRPGGGNFGGGGSSGGWDDADSSDGGGDGGD